MAIEQTQDSARRLEHLLLTREIEEFSIPKPPYSTSAASRPGSPS